MCDRPAVCHVVPQRWLSFWEGAIILLLFSEMTPCPRENRGSLDALSQSCHAMEVLLVVVAPPTHLPIKYNKMSEPSSPGWLNNSSPPCRRWSDCDLSTQILLIMLCVPLRRAHGCIFWNKICSFCLNSNTSVLFSQCYCVCGSRSRT